jgi:hypothetical protein
MLYREIIAVGKQITPIKLGHMQRNLAGCPFVKVNRIFMNPENNVKFTHE